MTLPFQTQPYKKITLLLKNHHLPLHKKVLLHLLLHSFSFKFVTPFQTKFKTPIKNNNKTLHQQSLSHNDTDITSDDENHIYTRIPKYDSSFSNTTLQENYSTLKKSPSTTSQESTSAIIV